MVNYDAERIKREYPRRPTDENPAPAQPAPPAQVQQKRASNDSKKSSVPRQTTTTPRQRNDSKNPQQQQQPLQKNRQSQSQSQYRDRDRGRSSGAAEEEPEREKKRLTITERMEKAHREHLSNKFMKIDHAPKDNVELQRQAYWGYADYHDSDAHWEAIREERGGKQKARAQSMMMNASSKDKDKDKARGKGDNHPPQTRASQMRMVYVQKKLSKGNDRRRSSSVVDSKSMLKKRDSKPMMNNANANANANGGVWNKNDGKNQVPPKKKSSARDSDVDGAKRLRPTKAQTRLAKGSVDSSEEEKAGKRPPPKRDRLRSKKD